LADSDIYPGEVMKVFAYSNQQNQAKFLRKSIEVSEKGSGSVHIKSNVEKM
jgi:hypothetical protein